MIEVSLILNNNVVFDSNELLGYLNSCKEEVITKEQALSKLKYFIETDEKVKYFGSMLTGTAISTFNYTTCYALDVNAVPHKISHAIDPILEILISLGEPVAYLMLVVGFLMVMTGKKSKGFEIIKWVIIGFLGLQFAPYLMGVIVETGKQLRGSL